MHAPKVTHEIDADEWIDWPPDAEAPGYDFTVWRGRLFLGFSYRGRRIFTAPVSIIVGGNAHGRYVHSGDQRKRIKKEPKDPSLISNGRVETMPRARSVLWKPRYEKRVVHWKPFKPDVRINGTELHIPTKDLFGKPAFDRWSFKNSDRDALANKVDKIEYEIREWCRWLVGNSLYKGAVLSAEWQGARVGNASPEVKGPAPTHEQLWAVARLLDKKERAVVPWNAHARHRPWGWKRDWDDDGPRVEENAKRYRRRLDAVTKSYDDLLRWNGKCTCAFTQAWHDAEEALLENIDNNREHWTPARPRLVVFILVLAFAEPWFFLGVWALLYPKAAPRSHLPPRWYACLRRKGDNVAATPLTEGEVLSDEALKRSSRVKAQSRKRVTLLKPDEILPAVMAAQQGIAGRNKLIDHFRPGIAVLAAQYASAANPVEDLINQGIVGTPADNGEVTNGLLYAIEKWNHSKGTFPKFAMTAVRWAILKYLELQPQQHVSLNAKVNADDDEDGDTLQDMIIDEGPYHGEEYETA